MTSSRSTTIERSNRRIHESTAIHSKIKILISTVNQTKDSREHIHCIQTFWMQTDEVIEEFSNCKSRKLIGIEKMFHTHSIQWTRGSVARPNKSTPLPSECESEVDVEKRNSIWLTASAVQTREWTSGRRSSDERRHTSEARWWPNSPEDHAIMNTYT